MSIQHRQLRATERVNRAAPRHSPAVQGCRKLSRELIPTVIHI